MANVDLAEEEATDAHLHPTGTLKVHSYSSIGRRYVLPTIRRYREAYPDIVVQLSCSQQMPDLFDGSCDVAIVAALALPDSDLVAHQVGSIYGVLCASKEYLEKRGTPRLPSELPLHDCLTLEVAAPEAGLWTLDGPAGRVEVPIKGVLQTNVSEVIVSGVTSGMGIGILPLFAAVDGLLDGTLVRVLPEFTLQSMNIYAIYPSRHFVDAKIKTWMECLQSNMPQAIQGDELALLSHRTLMFSAVA
ncbi:substrate binding domain-containing protein [Paraburkholderia sp. CNPSo 3076]|nr:substrate binding domain-containing protein [Paraburkholderia sp. CNPSo 3076]